MEKNKKYINFISLFFMKQCVVFSFRDLRTLFRFSILQFSLLYSFTLHQIVYLMLPIFYWATSLPVILFSLIGLFWPYFDWYPSYIIVTKQLIPFYWTYDILFYLAQLINLNYRTQWLSGEQNSWFSGSGSLSWTFLWARAWCWYLVFLR